MKNVFSLPKKFILKLDYKLLKNSKNKSCSQFIPFVQKLQNETTS